METKQIQKELQYITHKVFFNKPFENERGVDGL